MLCSVSLLLPSASNISCKATTTTKSSVALLLCTTTLVFMMMVILMVPQGCQASPLPAVITSGHTTCLHLGDCSIDPSEPVKLKVADMITAADAAGNNTALFHTNGLEFGNTLIIEFDSYNPPDNYDPTTPTLHVFINGSVTKSPWGSSSSNSTIHNNNTTSTPPPTAFISIEGITPLGVRIDITNNDFQCWTGSCSALSIERLVVGINLLLLNNHLHLHQNNISQDVELVLVLVQVSAAAFDNNIHLLQNSIEFYDSVANEVNINVLFAHYTHEACLMDGSSCASGFGGYCVVDKGYCECIPGYWGENCEVCDPAYIADCETRFKGYGPACWWQGNCTTNTLNITGNKVLVQNVAADGVFEGSIVKKGLSPKATIISGNTVTILNISTSSSRYFRWDMVFLFSMRGNSTATISYNYVSISESFAGAEMRVAITRLDKFSWGEPSLLLLSNTMIVEGCKGLQIVLSGMDSGKGYLIEIDNNTLSTANNSVSEGEYGLVYLTFYTNFNYNDGKEDVANIIVTRNRMEVHRSKVRALTVRMVMMYPKSPNRVLTLVGNTLHVKQVDVISDMKLSIAYVYSIDIRFSSMPLLPVGTVVVINNKINVDNSEVSRETGRYPTISSLAAYVLNGKGTLQFTSNTSALAENNTIGLRLGDESWVVSMHVFSSEDLILETDAVLSIHNNHITLEVSNRSSDDDMPIYSYIAIMYSSTPQDTGNISLTANTIPLSSSRNSAEALWINTAARNTVHTCQNYVGRQLCQPTVESSYSCFIGSPASNKFTVIDCRPRPVTQTPTPPMSSSLSSTPRTSTSSAPTKSITHTNTVPPPTTIATTPPTDAAVNVTLLAAAIEELPMFIDLHRYEQDIIAGSITTVKTIRPLDGLWALLTSRNSTPTISLSIVSASPQAFGMAGNIGGFFDSYPAKMEIELLNTTHIVLALAPVPAYTIDAAEGLRVYTTMNVLTNSPASTLQDGDVPIYVGSLTVDPDDSKTPPNILYVITAMVVGGGMLGMAGELQAVSAVAMTGCTNPHSHVALGSYRILSPLAVYETYAGVVLGNLLLVATVLLLQGMCMMFNIIICGHQSWMNRAAFMRFPSFTIMAIFAFHTGTVFASSRLISQPSMYENWEVAVGALGFVFSVLLPVALLVFPYYKIERTYQLYDRTGWLRTHMLPALFMRLIPDGAIFTVEMRQMYGPLISSYRLHPKHIWWTTMPTWTAMVVGVVAGLIHTPSTAAGCQALLCCIALVLVGMGVYIVVAQPLRSQAANIFQFSSRVLAGITIVCIAASLMGDRGVANKYAVNAALTFSILLITVTIMMVVFGCFDIYFDHRMAALSFPLSVAWTHLLPAKVSHQKFQHSNDAEEELVSVSRENNYIAEEGGGGRLSLAPASGGGGKPKKQEAGTYHAPPPHKTVQNWNRNNTGREDGMMGGSSDSKNNSHGSSSSLALDEEFAPHLHSNESDELNSLEDIDLDMQPDTNNNTHTPFPLKEDETHHQQNRLESFSDDLSDILALDTTF